MKPSDRNDKRGHSVQIIVLCMIAGLSAGTAQAQWRVIDNQAIRRLDDVKSSIGRTSADGGGNGTVTGNLKYLYQQQSFGKAGSYGENDKPTPAPEDSLKESPSEAGTFDVNTRCPQKSGQGGVSQQQWQLCKELVTTELAKYKYSLAMYGVSKKRQEWLKQIRDERSKIGETETGRLQDNTNKLLALMSQMEIDRQQQKTYMDAYDARIRYLTAASNTLAKHALDGTKEDSGLGGNDLGSVVGFAALKGALELAKAKKRYSH